MDDELVTSSSSARPITRGGGLTGRQPLFRYKDRFDEAFPFYLSIGMTPGQYWDGDATLTVAYRKAHEITRERRNEELWLQGLYVYEAILNTAPVTSAFSKVKKPLPYRSEPIPLTEQKAKELEEAANQKKLEEGRDVFRQMVAEFNKSFKEGGKADGNRDGRSGVSDQGQFREDG